MLTKNGLHCRIAPLTAEWSKVSALRRSARGLSEEIFGGLEYMYRVNTETIEYNIHRHYLTRKDKPCSIFIQWNSIF